MLRKTQLSLIPILMLLVFIFQGCTKDQCDLTNTYYVYEPVYMSYDELRSSVASQEAKKMESPGKIYFWNQYIFINERGEGIHVIDNSDRSNPQNIAFINIPGNMDIAARNGILYADSYVDLLALDISDPNNVQVVKRLENELPASMLWEQGLWTDPERGIVVDFEKTEQKEEIEIDCATGLPNYGYYYGGGVVIDQGIPGGLSPTLDAANGGFGAESSANPQQNGGGSMARFAIVSNQLYVIDNSDMHLYDIATPANPTASGDVNIGWNIETIYPYQDYLFIGSMTGMHIYDNSNPASPQFISTYQHIRSCDPVVVEDNYAYVTLRSGTPCQGFTNQLDVVDITDVTNPQLVTSYDMHNPHGLGIDNGTLFLCDAEEGLKVYDATDVNTIDEHMIDHKQSIHAYDVITLNGILFMIGDDGFYQYNYQDLDNIELISQIPVN